MVYGRLRRRHHRHPTTITIPAQKVTTTYYVRCLKECAVGPCNSYTVVVRGCPSDFACNGTVADDDFGTFAINYNLMLCSDPAMPAGCHADLNGDGLVDDADFLLFVIAYDALTCE